MLITVSLLGWALLKPYIVKTGVPDTLGRFTPILTGDNTESGQDGRPGTSGGVARQGGLNS